MGLGLLEVRAVTTTTPGDAISARRVEVAVVRATAEVEHLVLMSDLFERVGIDRLHGCYSRRGVSP